MHSTMSSDLIVDFPAQARQSAISVKHKKKMVTFSIMSDIRFYERPDKVHASELHYSRDDMTKFKKANRQAVRDVHTRTSHWPMAPKWMPEQRFKDAAN